MSLNSMSGMSTKTKRQLLKESTKNLILKNSRLIIIEKGVFNTTTKEISTSCNIAHGTIFSHFDTKENLISEVIKYELMKIAKELYQIKVEVHNIEVLLYEYLSLVEKNEDFLSVINREFSYLTKIIQREVLTTESIVKNVFYNEIKKGIKNNVFININIQVAISFLFGIMNYYLTRKEYFVSSGSVIKIKKDEIINTFIKFLKKSKP